MTLRFLLGVCLAASASLVRAETLTVRVIRVDDGDTLTILVGSRRVQLQLAEIDAPELSQAYGPESQRSLADLCFDKQAIAEYKSGGRVQIRCDGTDANAEQVARGMAWVERRVAKASSPLHFLLDQAQRNREGLWSDASPVAPWIWRRNRNRR